MNIDLPGVNAAGNHRTQRVNDAVKFAFEHRGQAFVRMRVSWDMDKLPIVHPTPGSDKQPRARQIEPGSYIVTVEVGATDLPGLTAKTIDSDLLINDVLVLRVKGKIPTGQNVDREGSMFRLVVV